MASRSALYELVRELRPDVPRPVVRFEGLPAELSQHDFGEACGTTTVKRVHFFASRLKYSRWTLVKLVPNERVSHSYALTPSSGIPRSAVIVDLGTVVELCWPRSPEPTGSVENLVGWVKGSFFKQRRFVDRADLERQLDEWHLDHRRHHCVQAVAAASIRRSRPTRCRTTRGAA